MRILKTAIHNRFDVFAKNIKTGKERHLAYAENVILNQFWTTWFVNTSTHFQTPFGYYIRIGKGTGTISAERTTMFSQLALLTATQTSTAWNENDSVYSRTVQATISETQYVGEYITEIGLASSLCLCTHALLKDMNGNAVSLEKTDVDIITFYATVYVVFDAEGLKQSKIVGSTLRNVLAGASPPGSLLSCQAFVSGLGGPIFSTAARELSTAYTFSVTKDAAQKKLISNTVRVPAGSANISGLVSLHLTTFGLWLDLRDPDIFPGSSIIGEQVGVGDGNTKDFVTAFDFVQSGAVVKVDGVEDATVVIDYNVPVNRNIGRFLKYIESESDSFFVGKNDSSYNIGSTPYCLYENEYASRCPIRYITGGIASGNTYAFSDDLETWTTQSGGGTITITPTNGAKRYIKTTVIYPFCAFYNILTENVVPNIHFSTPPLEGAVVTIDYNTPIIKKDANHVLDLSWEIQLSEYTPE